MESQLSANILDYTSALSNIVRYFNGDTIYTNPTDNMVHYLNNSDYLWARYQAILMQNQPSDSVTISNAMEALSQDFVLSQDDQVEHAYILQLAFLENMLLGEGKSLLQADSLQRIMLTELSQTPDGIVREYARNLLTGITFIFMKNRIQQVLLSGIIWLTIISNLSAQSYFSRRYDLMNDHGAEYSLDLIEEINRYILVIVSSTPNLVNDRIAFVTLDGAGINTGTPVVYYDPVCNIQTGFPGSFIKLSNSNKYACLGTKMQWVPEGRYDRGWLLTMNGLLDTLWTRTYTDDLPHDTSIMFRNFRELDDGGFIVVGLRNPVSGSGLWRIGMFRTDSAGNETWRRKFGSGNKDFQPIDVSATSDHGYVIGAEFSGTSLSTQDATPCLIKTDSIGNTQWTMNLGNPDCCETDVSVDLALDGNIQVGTYYSDQCWSIDGYEARINLLKVRNDKSIVWDKKYGFPKMYMYFSKIKVLSGGDIVGTGWYYYFGNGGAKPISWILRTDSAGNEKWYREYVLLNGPDSHNILQNIVHTNDGGFAACGFVVPAQPDTGTQDSWVLKVDSLGCVSQGSCWVGQDEIEVKAFTPGKPFVVYPNPADERLTVEFHHNPDGVEIELYDLFGRRLIGIHHPKNTDRAALDVSHLLPGIYLLRVFTGEMNYEAEKVVIK